jgi:SAM-dependent methyltransferase
MARRQEPGARDPGPADHRALKLNDPALVRAQYEDETRLVVRQAAHKAAEGPDALEMVFAAVAEVEPARVLDVGCGQGELAERIGRELGSEVVGVDQSARMVELTRARGVDARVGDVQALTLPDESFDCVVAAWMLFHVPYVDLGVSEIARVLRSGGRLVAATNGADHLEELRELVGTQRPHSPFDAENGEQVLLKQFARVERRSAHGHLLFPSHEAAQAYLDAAISISGVLRPFEGPIRVRRTPVVFVAEKA